MFSLRTRRAWLVGSLLLAGCARSRIYLGWMAAKSSESALTLGYTVGDADATTAFAAVDPEVRLVPLLTAQGVCACTWVLQSAAPYKRGEAEPLDAVLRATNFDASQLLPGALDAFRFGGQTYALPTSVAVGAVRYRPDAFASAGIVEPHPDWTIEDFEQVCAALQRAIATGRLAGYVAPLPPMVGQTTIVATNPASGGTVTGLDGAKAARGGPTAASGATLRLQWWGNLYGGPYGDFWAAFALGYGGALLRGRRFSLTDPTVLRGLQKAVDIARTYGAGLRYVPTTATAYQTSLAAYPMRFDVAYGPSSLPTGWSWARFPRLPVKPVVPVAPTGVQLTGPPNLQPPDEALATVVRYAQWRYQLARTDPGLPGLRPPVLSDPTVQDHYWSEPQRGREGAGPVGRTAWRDFVFVRSGWPPTGQVDPSTTVLAALTRVVTDGHDLSAAMSEAEAQINAAANHAAVESVNPSG